MPGRRLGRDAALPASVGAAWSSAAGGAHPGTRPLVPARRVTVRARGPAASPRLKPTAPDPPGVTGPSRRPADGLPRAPRSVSAPLATSRPGPVRGRHRWPYRPGITARPRPARRPPRSAPPRIPAWPRPARTTTAGRGPPSASRPGLVPRGRPPLVSRTALGTTARPHGSRAPGAGRRAPLRPGSPARAPGRPVTGALRPTPALSAVRYRSGPAPARGRCRRGAAPPRRCCAFRAAFAAPRAALAARSPGRSRAVAPPFAAARGRAVAGGLPGGPESPPDSRAAGCSPRRPGVFPVTLSLRHQRPTARAVILRAGRDTRMRAAS